MASRYTAPFTRLFAPRLHDPARSMPALELRLRRWTQIGMVVLACVLAVWSADLFREMDDPRAAGYAALTALLGGLALVWARSILPSTLLIAAATRPDQNVPEEAGRPESAAPRFLPVGVGLAIFSLLMIVNSDELSYLLSLRMSARLQFVLLCAGIALVTWGMAGKPHLKMPHLERREMILLGLITVCALALRLWHLETSLRVFVDEIHLSTGTTYFWGQQYPRLLQPIGVLMPFPRIFSYWMSEAVAVFGRNFTGLRFVSVTIGTLIVPAMYFLARQFFDRRIALAGAALLVTFPPFLHFSRIALINVADPLFGGLAVAFLARALHEGRRSDWALSGMALGLTQYFYEGGKVLFPLLLGVYLVAAVLRSMHVNRRLYAWFEPSFTRTDVLVWAGTALLVALPLWVTMLTEGSDVHARFADAGLGGTFWQQVIEKRDLMPFLDRLDNPFLIYTRLPDEARYYGGSLPLIQPVLVPLFLLGIAHALAWRERHGAWALVAWVVLTSLGNSLLSSSTIAARFIVVLPVLGLLMALGLMGTLDLLLPRAARLRNGIAAVLIALISIGQAAYYFGSHLSALNRQFDALAGPDGHDAVFRTADFPPDTRVHIVSKERPFTGQYADQLSAWVGDAHPVDWVSREDFTLDYLESLPRQTDHAFFFEQDDVQSAQLLADALFRTDLPQRSPYADDMPPEEALVLYYYHGFEVKV